MLNGEQAHRLLDRHIQVPPELYRTYTGNLACDSLPLATMALSFPVIYLYGSSRRYLNVVLFSFGWFLATVYHICHMDARGLHASKHLGIAGPAWRTYDILFAQWLLGRTWGEVLGAQHPLTLGLANGVFPGVVLAIFSQRDEATLGSFSKSLAVIMLATLASKFFLEGDKGWPHLATAGGARTLGFFTVAFVCFPMPAVFPGHYWLFHSLWHIFCSFGYWDLYCCLDRRPAYPIFHRKAQGKRNAPAAEAAGSRQGGKGL